MTPSVRNYPKFNAGANFSDGRFCRRQVTGEQYIFNTYGYYCDELSALEQKKQFREEVDVLEFNLSCRIRPFIAVGVHESVGGDEKQRHEASAIGGFVR